MIRGAAKRLRKAAGAVRVADAWQIPKKLDPRWDGAICLAGNPEDHARLRRNGWPIVNVSSRHDPTRLDVPSVVSDSIAAGRLAAEHLLSRGYRRLAALPWPGVPMHYAKLRRQGFFEAATEASTELVQAWDMPIGDLARTNSERVLRNTEWLESLPVPTGVLIPDDLYARGIMPLCRELGIRIPEDLGLVGVNNDDVVCETLDPPLTSVDLNAQRVGYLAAELLLDLLDGGPEPDEPIIVPASGIVTRQSTGLMAVDDPVVSEAVRLIYERIDRPPTVAGLAEMLHVDKRKLERAFKRKLGNPPATVGRKIRLERAAQLLTETDNTIQEIAEDVGFGSVHQFTKQFRAVYQTPPGAYRRERRLR
ncbi:MAG: substrate-binding domain-containing protein [Phycisphaerae bacterium]